jgi:CheY-like chemotaxis protein
MILLIDEEQRRMRATVDYLKELGYIVNILDNVDDADHFIEKHKNDIQAIILDIMMPWGNIFSSEQTEVGIITGAVFFERLRNKHHYNGPVIIYTALNKPALLNSLKQQANCVVVYKKGPSISKIVAHLNTFGVQPIRG